jgi:hypothetical protein
MPAKGKKANVDSSEESSDEDELPKVMTHIFNLKLKSKLIYH